MLDNKIIALAPAIELRRRAMGGVSLLSWDNYFPRGIEDLWAGPFVPAALGIVVPLRIA